MTVTLHGEEMSSNLIKSHFWQIKIFAGESFICAEKQTDKQTD